MSIGPSRAAAPRPPRADESTRRATRPEPPPAAEREAFERCYAHRGGERAAEADDAAREAAVRSDPLPPSAEQALRWTLAQQRLAQEVAAPPAAGAVDRELFELLARHVGSVLRPAGTGPSRIALRLDPRVFGGTDLWIEETAGGWRLDARSDDPRLVEALAALSGRLVERFAAAGLGALEVHCPAPDGVAGVGPR